jgi:large subunit ribosomal protein L6
MSTKQTEKMEAGIVIPENVKVRLTGHMLHVEGPLGKTHKNFKKIPVNININNNKIVLKASGTRKKHYAILNTAKSIIQTLCEGVIDGYTIKMKIISSHFPITVKTDGKRVLIENFQGEKAHRVTRIWGESKVISKGEDLIITGHVLTDVTQTAAEIQDGTKVKNKDHRVFLDGIYRYFKSKGIEK